MYIEGAFVLLLCLAATLTLVSVALAGASALLIPVGAVKLESAALPVRRVFAGLILTLPQRRTGFTTEVTRALFEQVWRALDEFAALSTGNGNAGGSPGGVIPPHITGAPLPMTFLVAEVVVVRFDLPRLTL